MPSYIRALDGLRGIAILLVVVFHFGYAGFGWAGVQLFYVISGFLITRILLEERKRPLLLYLKRFFWRRVLRIFPLYFTFLALMTVFYMYTKLPRFFWLEWPMLYSYTYNFRFLLGRENVLDRTNFLPHLWSLSVEEQFYIFWPFLLYFLAQRPLKTLLLVLIVGCPLLRFFLAHYLMLSGIDPVYTGMIIYCVTFCQLDAFAMGAWAASTTFDTTVDYRRRLYFLLTLSVFVGFVNQEILRFYDPKAPTIDFGFPLHAIYNLQHVWGYSLINLCSLLAIRQAIQPGRHRLLESSWLVYIGKISYGVYIFHFPLFVAILKLTHYRLAGWSGPLAFCLYFVVVIVLAHLSFKYFESRFLAMKDRI